MTKHKAIPTPTWDSLNHELFRAARLIEAALASDHWIMLDGTLHPDDPKPLRRQREEIAHSICRAAGCVPAAPPDLLFAGIPDDAEPFDPALDCAVLGPEETTT